MKTSFREEVMDVLHSMLQESPRGQKYFEISRELLEEVIEYARGMESYAESLESELDHRRWQDGE